MAEDTAASAKPSDTSGFTCRLGAGREARPPLVSAHLLQSMTASRLASSSPWRRTHFSSFWKGPWEDHCGAGADGQWAQDGYRVVCGGWVEEEVSDLAEVLGAGIIPRMSARHVLKLKGKRAS